MADKPQCILLFSGKRKCGKDYLTDKLVEILNAQDKVVIIKISAPIKSHFAQSHNLSLNDLMSSSEYKEKFRLEMIEWSDIERSKNPGVFCSKALDMYDAATKPIWIVSDVRRKTDISWFKANFGEAVKTVRVEANTATRVDRGWVFTAGVDDVQSECDLDDVVEWDWLLDNNSCSDPLPVLNEILSHIRMIM